MTDPIRCSKRYCDGWAHFIESYAAAARNRNKFKCHACGHVVYRVRVTAAVSQQRARKHQARRKEEEKKAVIWSEPRTQLGRKFRMNAVLRDAWREVCSAKTRPAIIRRGQKFVDLLALKIHDRPRTAERWSGLSVPTVVDYGKVHHTSLGLYTRGWNSGHKIKINITTREDRSLTAIRRTLVHEILHYIDAVAGCDWRGHDRLWDKRLRVLEKMLPPVQQSPRRKRRKVRIQKVVAPRTPRRRRTSRRRPSRAGRRASGGRSTRAGASSPGHDRRDTEEVGDPHRQAEQANGQVQRT